MKTRKNLAILVLTLVGLMVFLQAVFAGGSLEPTAPPGVVFKTLDEVEPRIPIKAADLPLTISEPNSYYLAETINFSVTDTNAITIECNDVTIDLMGYHLIGPGKAAGTSGNGIYMTSSNIEISNGTIRDFRENGIYSDSVNDKNHRIIGVRALSNGNSGIYLGSNHHMVKDCTASNNMFSGIYVMDNCVVTGNMAYNNSSGIDAGGKCVITGNVASMNGNNGIYIFAYGSMITGNTAGNNQNNGIYTDSYGSMITGNTTTSNTNYGIYANNYALIDQNASYSNGTNLYTGTGSQVGLNVAP